ncbi:hypothetical protein J7M28_12370 [bacterium]|nr:hypothetical protein [bacterium]
MTMKRESEAREASASAVLFSILVFCIAILPMFSLAAEYTVSQDGTGHFNTIQAAIDASIDGDVITVHPGTYDENIHFDGKSIVLRSLDPTDEQIVASTIIDGGQKDSVVKFAGTQDESCLLSGFTITRGHAKSGGGILGADPWSDPPVYTLAGISNCTISGNEAKWAGGLGFCSGKISNCTISGNMAEYEGGGLRSYHGPSATAQ